MGWKVLKSAQIPHIMFFSAVKEEDYVMILFSHDIFDTQFGQCKATESPVDFFFLLLHGALSVNYPDILTH